jgi:hypothetical protein
LHEEPKVLGGTSPQRGIAVVSPFGTAVTVGESGRLMEPMRQEVHEFFIALMVLIYV